jgi:hypothetical protein
VGPLLDELHAERFRPYLELELGQNDDPLRVFCELDNETLLDISIGDEGIPDAPVAVPDGDWVVFVQSISGGYLAEVYIDSTVDFRELARRLHDLVDSVVAGERPFLIDQ